MKIECLNTIKRKGDKWEFTGKFMFNGNWIPVTGTVNNMNTDSQIKTAIIKRVRAKAENYKRENQIPKNKVLPIDTVFKESI